MSQSNPKQWVWNEGQQNALTQLESFLADPNENTFVLYGGPGRGKTALIQELATNMITQHNHYAKVINIAGVSHVQLTATTKKACSVLEAISRESVPTIHTLLGLRVLSFAEQRLEKNKGKGLADTKKCNPLDFKNVVVVIDEFTYINRELMAYIKHYLKFAKVIFVGDFDQVLAVNESTCVVKLEDSKYSAELIEPMRQDMSGGSNPIVDFCDAIRHIIRTNEWPEINPGKHIRPPELVHTRDADLFQELIEAEYQKPDFDPNKVRVIAWRNATVQAYNDHIAKILGKSQFTEGDIVVSNKYVRNPSGSVSNNADVVILNKNPGAYKVALLDGSSLSFTGSSVLLSGGGTFFLPNSFNDVQVLNKHRSKMSMDVYDQSQNDWVDLRHPYACTADKSQGSTYDTVFIDLNDLGSCNQLDRVRRMLYVAVSRAKYRVVMYGDIRV